jgi:hypothetical protein
MVSVPSNIPLNLLIFIMTGGTVDCRDKVDLQQTEMFGANYAVGNNHIGAFSKIELSILSIKGFS